MVYKIAWENRMGREAEKSHSPDVCCPDRQDETSANPMACCQAPKRSPVISARRLPFARCYYSLLPWSSARRCGSTSSTSMTQSYVYENHHVQQGVTLQSIVWAFTAFDANNWHPLTWLSHMLDVQFYGLWAGGHHLTNVLLHGLSVIVLFLVLRQMTGRLWPSAVVAAVFAIHPLHVESVAWVAERKDVLSGLFFMLTLAAYLGYVRRPFSVWRYLLVVVSFALGLMAKPMLVTLPLVLLLLDYWPLGRWGLPGTADTPTAEPGPILLARVD